MRNREEKSGTGKQIQTKEGEVQGRKRKAGGGGGGITAAWEREGSRGGPGTQKRSDRAPRARHSPQLSLSALPGDSAASGTSLSCAPPFLFRNSGRLAVLHLRENTHVSRLLADEAP